MAITNTIPWDYANNRPLTASGASTAYGADWRDNMIQQMQMELSQLRASQPKGLTDTAFNNKDDSLLILELIARGYAVYKPMEG